MSKTLEKIQGLADTGDILISEHGYDELSNDNLTAREIVDGVKHAVLIEDYPYYPDPQRWNNTFTERKR